MISRYLHVLYCDDVRNEVNNKTSLIGVYGADLFVTEIPTSLPKLALAITVAGDINEPIEELSLRILRDDEQIGEITVSRDEIAASREQNRRDGKSLGRTLFAVNSVVVMSPFPITEPFTLRIVAKTEREELRGPSLKVALAPSAETGPGSLPPT